MLSSPPCPGCTTHTGCEAIPGLSGATFNDLDTVTHLQSEGGIASIQSHGTGNDTSRGALPVPCLAPPGAGRLGGPGGETWLRVAGQTSSMEAMNVATPSFSPHAAVNEPPFPLLLLLLSLRSMREPSLTFRFLNLGRRHICGTK